MIKRLAKQVVERALPLSLCRRFCRRNLTVLYYHIVSDETLPHVRHLYPFKTTAEFDLDLQHLVKYFQPISYEDLLAARHRDNLPPRSVLVTFDDGYAEHYSVVKPILKNRGVPCIFFVTTDFIGNDRLFYRNKASLCIDKAMSLDKGDWKRAAGEIQKVSGVCLPSSRAFSRWIDDIGMYDEDAVNVIDMACATLSIDEKQFLDHRRPYMTLEQIRELAGDGFTIGSHGQSHAPLFCCDRETIAREIVESSELVRQWTGQQQVPFAFPYSAADIDREFLADILANHDFIQFLFGTDGFKLDEPFLLNRVWLDAPGRGSESNVPHALVNAYMKLVLSRCWPAATQCRRS